MSSRNLHIELTSSENGNKIFIFKNHVVTVENGILNDTIITMVNGHSRVKESTEEVLDMFYTW